MRNISSFRSRRDLLRLLTLGTGTLFVSPASLFADEPTRRETADLILGPFYPQRKPSDTDVDLTILKGRRHRAAGQIVRFSGRVMNLKGQPVRNATIEVWQANMNGRYAHASDPNTHLALDPDFQGYGALRTDNAGMYAFTTIKPGAYPTARGDLRAPHIHFEVRGVVDRKVTQMFFPNEPLNDQDRHLRSVRRPETLIARVSQSGAGNELAVDWDIVLTNG